VVSYALYPKVIKGWLEHHREHGDTSVLDTETFLYGLQSGREILVQIEPGKSLVVERVAIGELRPEDKTREVFFMLNGQPRSAVVLDLSAGGDEASSRRADPTDPKQIGAPMPGTVIALEVSVGDQVQEGQSLGVVEAMKLETAVRAPISGTVKEIAASVGQRVESGDLLLVLG
jgi:pyruvate carboxylase